MIQVMMIKNNERNKKNPGCACSKMLFKLCCCNPPFLGVFDVLELFIAVSVLLLFSTLISPLSLLHLLTFIADILFLIPFNGLSDSSQLLFCCWRRVKSSDFEAFKLFFFLPLVSLVSSLLFAVLVSSTLSIALLRLLKKFVFSRNNVLRTNYVIFWMQNKTHIIIATNVYEP